MHKEIRSITQKLVVSEAFLHCGKCGSIVIIKLYISIILLRVSSVSPLIFFITLELAEQVSETRESNCFLRVKHIHDIWHNTLFSRLQRLYN